MNSSNTEKTVVYLRLAWLESRAIATGWLNRGPYCEAWGICPAQASSDIGALLAATPAGYYVYEPKEKSYRYAGTGERFFTTPPNIKEYL